MYTMMKKKKMMLYDMRGVVENMLNKYRKYRLLNIEIECPEAFKGICHV